MFSGELDPKELHKASRTLLASYWVSPTSDKAIPLAKLYSLLSTVYQQEGDVCLSSVSYSLMIGCSCFGLRFASFDDNSQPVSIKAERRCCRADDRICSRNNPPRGSEPPAYYYLSNCRAV